MVVLFDMDGVLVRSEEVWFRVVESAGVRFRGRAVTRAEFFPTFGQGTAADIPVFSFSCTAAELDAFYATEFLRHLEAIWVNPEAATLLSLLGERGTPVALVTNTVGALTRSILEHARLAHFFPVRATADRVPRAKPAPDLLHLALDELGASPPEAVMVGDSRFDRQAAEAAGVHFVGLKLDGTHRIERLLDLPAVVGLGASTFRLRPATAGDRASVERLLRATAMSLTDLERQFPSAWMLAEAEGALVGVAGLERVGERGRLRSVTVDEAWRGRGIGSALVEERLSEARKAGLTHVSLSTTSSAFFEARGFRPALGSDVDPELERSPDPSRPTAHLVWKP